MFPDLGDVLTVDEDAATLHVIKAEKQTDDGAFSWSRRTNLLNKTLAGMNTVLLLYTLSYSINVLVHNINTLDVILPVQLSDQASLWTRLHWEFPSCRQK